MERKNIFLIIILVILVALIGVGVILYEQQQVKSHLTQANNYHSQMMAYNPQLTNATSNIKAVGIINKTKPLLTNEMNELRAANTIFASPIQKEYINDAIQVNTDNAKEDDLIIVSSKTTNLNQLTSYKTNYDVIYKDVVTTANNRDSIVSAHPEEFGFEIVKL